MAALFGAMTVMALVPSISVATVSARAAAYGFRHGATVTFGIVLGDIVFILFAIFGLRALADKLHSVFVLIQYVGSLYLIWLGFKLWQSRSTQSVGVAPVEESLRTSFLAGLLITLADQKAIFFYLGFFPAFIDLATLSYTDAGLVIIIAAVAVGGAKLGYAYAAHKSRALAISSAGTVIQALASCVMVAAGVLLAIKASLSI